MLLLNRNDGYDENKHDFNLSRTDLKQFWEIKKKNIYTLRYKISWQLGIDSTKNRKAYMMA